MTTILITNVYSSRNRGDAAIVLGMIESLRRTEEFADAEIVVCSSDPINDAAAYGEKVVPSFQSVGFGCASSSTLAQLWFLLFVLPASLLWAGTWRCFGLDLGFGQGLRKLCRAYAEADLVVAAGGGYLYTNSVLRGNLVLMGQVYAFFFGRILGKPVILYAQSIGPFAGFLQARFVRMALSRVALVEVREEVSYGLLEGWEMPAPVRVTADAAFLLKALPPAKDFLYVWSDGTPTIGMTVRRWFRDGEQQSGYERTVASFVDWLIEERGAVVVFLPQVTYVEGNDDDRTTARNVVALVAQKDRTRIVEAELKAGEIKWLCGRMDFFVGTRMHSNIFALSSGVPTLAIAYQPKTDGIMSDLGLEDCVVPIEGLAVEEMQRAFDAMVDRSPGIKSHLRSTIRKMETKALEAGRLVAKEFVQWENQDCDLGGNL